MLFGIFKVAVPLLDLLIAEWHDYLWVDMA